MFVLQMIYLFIYMKSVSCTEIYEDVGAFGHVDIFVTKAPVDYYRGAYEDQVSSPVFIQHGLQVREEVSCFRLDDVSSLPIGSVYSWVTKFMHPIAQKSMRPLSTGELEIINATLEDSGFYRCVVTSSMATIRLIFNRPIVVYDLPQFFFTRDIVFRIPRRDKMLARQVFKMVLESFCKGLTRGCLYTFTDMGFQASGSFYNYKIEMKQLPDNKYKQPKCDPACIRTSAENYMLANDVREKDFSNFEFRQMYRIKKLTKFVFVPGENHSKYHQWCKDGFFLWRDEICLPCSPGYYGYYGSCWKCGYFQYQVHFASKRCNLCPKLGFSFKRGKSDPDECVPFQSNRVMQFAMLFAGIASSMGCYVCALHCGLLPCIYKPPKNGGKPTKKDAHYLKVLDKHRQKAQQIKRLLTRAKQIEKEMIGVYSKKKVQISKQNEMLEVIRLNRQQQMWNKNRSKMGSPMMYGPPGFMGGPPMKPFMEGSPGIIGPPMMGPPGVDGFPMTGPPMMVPPGIMGPPASMGAPMMGPPAIMGPPLMGPPDMVGLPTSPP
ncbi:hypothetical protein HELRODRAFT_179415 [Helobdella robusta]|uniref:Ig-like domain-containing protein n=1 Tax=Helobdella robusta TaxID=6412 RepID=T1FEN8_HELRO|nr:hypothetical protein HELRODRAFT_179415 [Helobdella robusta]ESN95347.1 hypothetical protein HELRODRAFT_179415 [Helobdella robusta]